MTLRPSLTTLLFLLLLPAALRAAPDPVRYSGRLDVTVATAYLTSSGSLNDTRPVSTQCLSGKADFGDWGYLDGYAWFISALHDMQHDRHRALLNEFEGAVRYGHAFDLPRKFSLDSRLGPVWNPPFGYRHSHQNYWGPNLVQTLHNPYITPYWNGLWLLAPELRGRVRFGLSKTFDLAEDLTLMPFVESVWMDRRRFGAKYGDDPENDHVFGGAFATSMLGVQLTWRVAEHWQTYLILRQFDIINDQARRAVKRSENYWAKCDWPVARLGVAYIF